MSRMSIKDDARKMKTVAPYMAASDIATRNSALMKIKEALLKNSDEIFKANAVDMENA